MSKVNLTRWRLFTYDDKWYLSGIADNHPVLGRNISIGRTSHILKATLENDVLYAITGNNEYVCPLKYMNINKGNFVIEDTEVDSVCSTLYSLWVNIIEGTKTPETDRLLKLVDEGSKELEEQTEMYEKSVLQRVKQEEACLYIEFNNLYEGIAAYNIQNNTGIIYPYVHSGMFQDSVLYMERGIVDFRYFPKENNTFEVYNWSEGLDKVIVKNNSNKGISYNGYLINPDEEYILDKSTYTCGLVSPDSVTGQSVLNDLLNK